MSAHALVAAGSLSGPTLCYTPGTFLERGVMIPFTTPMLAGARVRPTERDGLELIIANPSGGRGVYILPWEGVSAICTPTLHDRMLNSRVQMLQGVTPFAIRQLALDVAQEGLAGREVAAAAAAARTNEQRQRVLTNFELLTALVRQVEGRPCTPGPDLEARAQRALAAVGSSLRQSPAEVATILEDLGTLFAPLGVGSAAVKARVPAAISSIGAMRAGVAEALRGPPALTSTDADLIMASADLTMTCARATLAAATMPLNDLRGLLRSWVQTPEPFAAKAARPEWLLDGWEQICLLWRERPQAREEVFSEMTDLVPAMPREAGDWVSTPVETMAGALRHHRMVQLNEDWRTGLGVHDLVARNERLQAQAFVAAAA